jgi:hypothetical protein
LDFVPTKPEIAPSIGVHSLGLDTREGVSREEREFLLVDLFWAVLGVTLADDQTVTFRSALARQSRHP